MPTGGQPDPLRTALTLAALGGSGYLAYRHVWVPRQIRKRTERELWLRSQQQPAITAGDGLEKAGIAACMGAAAYYSVPPQQSAGMCQILGPGAAALLRETPGLIRDFGGAVGSATQDIGEGVGAAAAGIGKGIGEGVTSVGKSAVDIPAYAVGTVYKQGKTVFQDFYAGGKGVFVDLGEGAGTVWKGGKTVAGDVWQATVETPVKSVGRAAGRAGSAAAKGASAALKGVKKLKFW